VFTQLFHSNGCTRHILYRDKSSTVACGHYLTTALSLAQNFLLWENMPQYCQDLGMRDLWDGFWSGWLDLLAPSTHNSVLQAITALSIIYTLYSSLLHTHKGSQSSLIVSWQRIYKSRTVAAALNIKSYLHSLIPLLLNHSIAVSRNSLNSDSNCLRSSSYSFGADPQKTPFPKHSSIVTDVCLPRRCIETAILRLLLAYSLPWECVYRTVA
jgi:hypothetical protein